MPESLDSLLLDMIANTDCSWAVATAALAFWEKHLAEHTAPVYDILGEKANIVYDRGPVPRSLRVGMVLNEKTEWFLTLLSES